LSVHAGTILHIGGNNVIDRIQSAGLGDARVPIETIREVGNYLVVDKVPGEADFTFTLESWDASTDLMAFLCGKVGAPAVGSPPGAGDAPGTVYRWEDANGHLNIPSPWKDPATGGAGDIVAGHLIPGFFPTRVRYRFGVTDNATQEAELAGGAFYYAQHAPVEDVAAGDGTITAFTTQDNVIVNGNLQTEGVDYTVSGGDPATPAPVTVTFLVPPPVGAQVRMSYFTDEPKAWPQATNADATVKPGAVRGRNIKVYLGAGGARQRLGNVQTAELEATIDTEVERELGNDEIVGRTVNGRDTTGTITTRSRNAQAFIALLSKVTGVDPGEVFGFFNQHTIPLTIQIQNPKVPSEIIKTLYVSDAQFQPPGTPARVNTPTDFGFRFDSLSGTFQEIKGAFAP
jgi:hypothetical protein